MLENDNFYSVNREILLKEIFKLLDEKLPQLEKY